MASLFNTKISDTYPGLIKTLDNAAISASLKELTDGSGNQSGLFINTAGDFKATGILEFGSLKDTGENITITKFVDEADGIANNDNDTTIPTSAAVVDYVASKITLEDLDFSGDSGTGSVDLDSQVFAITGTANQIETTASGQGISFAFPSAGIVLPDGSTATTQTDGDNSTKVATTAYVDTAIAGHDTLAEVLAGGNTSGANDIIMLDNQKVNYGTDSDLKIYHSVSDSFIINETGNLKITQGADDKDIILESDNGSGGTTAYITLDGSATTTIFSKNTRYNDNIELRLGNGSDLKIYHNTVNSVIENDTGNLVLMNTADNRDIVFQSDNGSGGTATYFALDGGITRTVAYKNFNFQDDVKLEMGTGADLQIYHDGSNSRIDDIGTGSLITKTNAFLLRNPQDASMLDAQSGAEINLYYNGFKKFETTAGGILVTGTIDSSGTIVSTGGNIRVGSDTGKLMAGASNDLQMYHNGSHSYIDDTGTGKLIIRGSTSVEIHKYTGEYMLTATEDGAVSLYYDDSKKLETTNTGVSVTGGITSGDITISDNNPNLTLSDTSTTNLIHEIKSASDKLQISADSNNVDAGTKIEFLIDGTEVLDLSNTTASFAGSVTIAQDLTVNGTTTTVNTQTLAVEDPLISLAKDNSANSVDIGFYGKYNDGTNRYLGLFSDASNSNKFKLFKGLETEPTTTVDTTATGYTLADLDINDLSANKATFTGADTLSIADYVLHEGDADTKFGFPSADTFKIRTGGTDALNIDSSQNTTFAGNLNLVDNKKLKFGAGDDLQFSHNSTTNVNFISSKNDRQLVINSQYLYIRNEANNEDMAQFLANGAVNLFYNNVKKFETTSTGVNITDDEFTLGSGSYQTVLFDTSPSSVIGNGTMEIEPQTVPGSGTANFTTYFKSNVATGTTNHHVKIDGNLGVGITPTRDIHLHRSTLPDIHITNDTTGSGGTDGATFTLDTLDLLINNREAGNVKIYTSGTEKFIINSAGNVGIDVSAPDSYNSAANKLVIGGSGDSGITISTSSTNMGTLMFADGTGGTAGYRGRVSYDHDGDYMRFDTAAAERMRILANGNVGIANDNAYAKLQVRQTADTTANILSNGDYGFIIEGNDSGTAGESVGLHLSAKTVGSNPVRGVSLLAEVQSTSNDHDLLFATSDAGAAPLERMRLTGNGNLILRNVNHLENPTTDFLKELFIVNLDGVGTFASNGASNGAYGSFNFKTRKGDSSDPLNMLTMDNSLVTIHRNARADGTLSLGKTSTGYRIDMETIAGGNAFRTTRGTSSFRIFQANDGASFMGTENDADLNIQTNASTVMTIDNTGEVKINKSIHLGSDSNVVTPAQYSMLIEAPTGNSTNINMYTLGSSVFNISSDGTTGTIGWGSSQAREVNFVNTGAGSLKVGINEGAPTSVLSVKTLQDTSFDEGIGVIRSNSSQTGYINMVGGAMNINAPSSIPIKFRDGGTSNLEINANGHTVVNNDLNVEGGLYGKSYSQSGTSGTTSQVDTGIAGTISAIYECYVVGNLNAGGSASYRSVKAGLIMLSTDYSAPNVVTKIGWQTLGHGTGGSGSNEINVVPKLLIPGVGSFTQVNSNIVGTAQIRLEIGSYNSSYVGSAQEVRIIRKI